MMIIIHSIYVMLYFVKENQKKEDICLPSIVMHQFLYSSLNENNLGKDLLTFVVSC